MIGPAEIREMVAEYEASALAASPSWPRPAAMWPIFVDEAFGQARETAATLDLKAAAEKSTS